MSLVIKLADGALCDATGAEVQYVAPDGETILESADVHTLWYDYTNPECPWDCDGCRG